MVNERRTNQGPLVKGGSAQIAKSNLCAGDSAVGVNGFAQLFGEFVQSTANPSDLADARPPPFDKGGLGAAAPVLLS